MVITYIQGDRYGRLWKIHREKNDDSKKNGNVDIGEIIDYDHGFDDDTEETFLMNTLNGEPHTYQEIKIADIVNMKEV